MDSPLLTKLKNYNLSVVLGFFSFQEYFTISKISMKFRKHIKSEEVLAAHILLSQKIPNIKILDTYSFQESLKKSKQLLCGISEEKQDSVLSLFYYPKLRDFCKKYQNIDETSNPNQIKIITYLLKFLNHTKNNKEYFSVLCITHSFQEVAGPKFLTVLSEWNHLKHLTLTDIIPQYSVRLCEFLKSTRHLKQLSLNGKCEDSFYDFIGVNKSLEVITFRSYDISENSFENLSSLLSKNKFIKELYFCSLNLKNKLIHLAKMLEANHNIKKLILNNIHPELSDILLLSDALQKNDTLNYLEISNNLVNDKAISSLSKVIRENIYITELILYNNLITEIGAKELLESILINPTLLNLSLLGNFIGKGAKQALQEVKSKHPNICILMNIGY
jgi:hypothetical protein